MARVRLLAALVVAVGLVGAAPAGAALKVTTEPKLYPRFDTDVNDYVVRCDPKRRLVVSVDAGEKKVAVGDRAPRKGNFEVRLRRRAGEAVTVRGKKTHHIRCLPRSFRTWRTVRRGTPQAQWYILTALDADGSHGSVAVFDTNGVPLWWWRTGAYMPWDAKLLPNGNLLWVRHRGDPFGLKDGITYDERRLDGRLVRRIAAVGAPTDTHELTRLRGGNSYVLTYRPRDGVDLSAHGGPPDARVFDTEIQELLPDGRVAWKWNSGDHIDPSEVGHRWWPHLHNVAPRRGPGRTGYDLVHGNSVEPDGDGVILSARHVNAVYRIDKATGAIDWKLGGSTRPESLTVPGHIGDEDLFGGQHDARLYRDGTLTVFDNGTTLVRPPKALRYRIDAPTATEVESIGHPAVQKSNAVGSARKLPDGNWVVFWGDTPFNSELSPSGDRVLDLIFDGQKVGYRLIPVLPGRLTARELRRGMNRIAAARRGRR